MAPRRAFVHRRDLATTAISPRIKVIPLHPMIRFFAKREYRKKLELAAATNDINAQLAENRAKEKRAYVDQLNREADDIEANIADVMRRHDTYSPQFWFVLSLRFSRTT
jgi:hypothetical protein